MNRKFCGVLVVLVAIFLGFLNLLTSMSADVPNPTEYSGDLLLDRNGKYNVPTIAMPKSTGTALRVMEYLFNKIPMCELIRHFFYKTTQFYRVRFLADQIKDAPRLGFPFKRLSPSELRRHEGREDMNLGDIKNKKQKFNSVLDFHELFKSNKSKPSIVLTQVLAHAKSIQSEYKPFKIIFANLEQLALESDKRFQNMKPLSIWDGVPIAVKDDFAVIGSSVSLGRDPAIAAFHVLAEQDDAVIAEFKRLGAIVIGVTVMHELAISAFGWNKHVSGPLNAWSKKHMAGGSSAGCGVVVAAGIVPVCIGTDSGGSIRIPAAWNGIFGLAPTFGRVQSTASSISHSTILHVGPMAATATDTALAYLLMASVKVDGHVYASEYGPNLPPAHLGTELASVLESKKNALQYLKTVKVGLFNDWIKDGTDPDILALFNQVVTKVFPNTIPFEIPHMYEQQLSHGIAFMSEAAFVHQQSFFNPKILPLESTTRIALGMSMEVSGIDVVAAEKLKGWTRSVWEEEFEKFNVILLPTQGALPYEVTEDIYEEGVADNTFAVNMISKTFITNLHGYPSITVPIGLVNDLPVGLQVMCKHWEDDVCLTVAAAIETVFEKKVPESFRDVLQDR